MEKLTPTGALIGAGTGIISMLGQRKREQRAMQNQQKLMGLQFEHQQALNKQGSELQYDMWKKTNFPAQLSMLKEAGLSTGLMYGGSGGGGTTTGSQSGGSAASGNAPSPQPMDLGTALQAAEIQSQIDVNKATANKLNADAASTKGEAGTLGASQIEKLKAETKHEAVKETLTQAQKYLKDVEYGTAVEQSVITGIDRAIKNATWQDQVQAIKAEVANTLMDTELKKMNIEATDQQREAIKEGIIQRWWEIGVKGVGTIINGVLGKGAIEALSKSKQ